MSKNLDNYQSLSVPEHIQLVDDIWDSIAKEAPESLQLSEAEKQELDRRVEAHRVDSSTGVPWGHVRDKLFQRSC